MKVETFLQSMGMIDERFLDVDDTESAVSGEIHAEYIAEAGEQPKRRAFPLRRVLLTAGCAAACIVSAVMLFRPDSKKDYTFMAGSSQNMEITRDVPGTETTPAERTATDLHSAVQNTMTVTQTESDTSAETTVQTATGKQTSVTEAASVSRQSVTTENEITEVQSTPPVTEITGTASDQSVRIVTHSGVWEESEEEREKRLLAEHWDLDSVACDLYAEKVRRAGLLPESIFTREFTMDNEFRCKQWSLPDEDGYKIETIHYINCAFEDGFYYAVREDGSAVIAGGDAAYLRKKSPEKMVIPDTVGGAVVTEIAMRAFYFWNNIKGEWTELREIVIPDTVEIVGQYAFDGVFVRRAGNHINLPANLREIHFRAFADLGTAFGNDINLPETVELMQDSAFSETAGVFTIRNEEGNLITENVSLHKPDSLAEGIRTVSVEHQGNTVTVSRIIWLKES